MESLFTEKSGDDDKLIAIAEKVDRFEGYEGPHAVRIASIADSLAVAFNLASRDRFFLHQAALLHDIGEMIMNREYIRSSRVLASNERIDLQRHPVIGEQETAKLGLPRGVQLIVRWHQEWWNGSGYPDGIQAEQIPLAARILRLADAYASLTADRPYRAAWNVDLASKYLVEWAGIEFDPGVVKAFMSVAKAQANVVRQEIAVPTAS